MSIFLANQHAVVNASNSHQYSSFKHISNKKYRTNNLRRIPVTTTLEHLQLVEVKAITPLFIISFRNWGRAEIPSRKPLYCKGTTKNATTLGITQTLPSLNHFKMRSSYLTHTSHMSPEFFYDAMWDNVLNFITDISDISEDLLTLNEWLVDQATSNPTIMTGHDYLFKRIFETVAYDHTHANVRIITINFIQGSTPSSILTTAQKRLNHPLVYLIKLWYFLSWTMIHQHSLPSYLKPSLRLLLSVFKSTEEPIEESRATNKSFISKKT